MTDKEVIDGVNVAGCCCFENGKCLWQKKYYESGITPDCNDVEDCYYKQLQCKEQECERLQSENEELKKEYWKLEQGNDFIAEKNSYYKQALEEIKQDLECNVYCESQGCGCNEYGECLNCVKNRYLKKINEVLKDE